MAKSAEGKGRREARRKMEAEKEVIPPPSATYRLQGAGMGSFVRPVASLWPPHATDTGLPQGTREATWRVGSCGGAEACAR